MDAYPVAEEKPRLSPRRLVKVFLHGKPFGRKINLSVHNSYESLSFTLKRLGNNYSLSQFELSGLEITEADGALDENDFILLYDNVDGDRFFLGEVPWEDFIVSVKKIYILPGEKEDDNEDYLEEGDGDNGGVNAAVDGNEDTTGGDGALATTVVVTDDVNGDSACDHEDVVAGGNRDDDVVEDGDDSSEE